MAWFSAELSEADPVVLKSLLGLGALASAPEIVDFASRFGRTIILARLLSPAELGICVAIGVVLTIGYLVSDIGLDKFVMSHPRGDDQQVLAAAHQLQVVRACILAVIIFGTAPWIAQFLGAPDDAATFRWCGGIVLLHGFVHLEIMQVQRDFRYAPAAAAKLLARLAAFAAVYPAARGFGDHRAMTLSLFLDATVYVAASHLFARTRYHVVATDRRIVREAIAYGLPLTLNGMGIAANSQFDRGLVSYWLGLETLALYAVILNLAIIPISVIGGILGPLGLSFLMRTRNDANSASDSYLLLVWVYAIVSAAYAVFVAGTLDILVPLIFGQKYMVPSLIHALITMIAWLRINRGAPTAMMLVHGDTRRLMAANLVAGCGLVLSAVLLQVIPRLETVLFCLLLGDILSLVFFFRWAWRRGIAQTRAVLRDLWWSFVPAALASVGVFLLSPQGLWGRAVIFCGPALVISALLILGFRHHIVRNGLALTLGRPKHDAS